MNLQASPEHPGGERVLARFADAAVPADWSLSWAAAAILEDACGASPHHAHLFRKYALQCFNSNVC
jgi:hypothetical protein